MLKEMFLMSLWMHKEQLIIHKKNKDTSTIDEWGNPTITETTETAYGLVRSITSEDFALLNSGIVDLGDLEVVLNKNYDIDFDDVIEWNNTSYLVKQIIIDNHFYIPSYIYRCSKLK